jgi:hypothetical protein
MPRYIEPACGFDASWAKPPVPYAHQYFTDSEANSRYYLRNNQVYARNGWWIRDCGETQMECVELRSPIKGRKINVLDAAARCEVKGLPKDFRNSTITHDGSA